MLSGFIRKFARSFHAFLCMTLNIIRPWRYRFGIRFLRGFCFWYFFFGPGGNPWFEHTSVIIHNILANLTFSLSATHINMVEEWCWSSQINVFRQYLPCWTNVLLFCLPVLFHPHTQIRIVLLHGVRINISNWKLSPNRVWTELSRMAFPTVVLPKDDRTDSFQEERLGLPYWTMIWATCVSVDVSKNLDILTLEFSITSVHLPFWAGYKRILHLLLVLRIPVVLKQYPWLLQLSSVTQRNLALWILHKRTNHLLHCYLGVQLGLCIFEIEALTPNSWDDKDPSKTKNELFCPYSLLLRSPLFCFWLLSAPMPVSFPIFPILCPLLPLHPVRLMLETCEQMNVPNCNDKVNLFLLQRCDLRDTCAAHLPIVLS